MCKVEEVVAECLFRIGKNRAVRRRTEQGAVESQSADNYVDWRRQSLEEQFTELFDPHLIKGKEVLDFACGLGALSLIVARLGAKRVCGIDLRAKDIATAIKDAESSGITVDFRVASKSDRIELADSSWDVILCFDALEHIIEYESIIPEWKRVLRRNGKVLIWWGPYFHPYGHHVDTYVPVPWMHVLVPEKIINMACSKMVNLPEFSPPYWDLDEHGNRRDRFAVTPVSGTLRANYLNRLTISKFERLCAVNGFRFARREFHTFRRLKRLPFVEDLLTLPGLREFFTSFVVYELASP